MARWRQTASHDMSHVLPDLCRHTPSLGRIIMIGYHQSTPSNANDAAYHVRATAC